MAEELFPYHIPHQNRRDKLRLSNQTSGWVQNLQGFVPLYDGSLVSADFVGRSSGDGVKEPESLVGFANPGNVYADPQMLNPSSVSDFVAPYGFQAPSCYRGVVMDQPFLGNSANAQSLSLSLSSHSLEMNMQKNEPQMFSKQNAGGFSNSMGSGSSSAIEMSKNTVPLGPFTGYASVLKGSRFLRPAQQLLEEICGVGRGILDEINVAAESFTLDPPPVSTLSSNEIESGDGRKKSKLLSMLDEVYKRYKQYFQQMQTALAAFESVSGVSGAAPFACLALKTMSKHFRFLKKAIIDQLQSSNKIDNQVESSILQNSGVRIVGNIVGNKQMQGVCEPPVWRPQRGLPERAVSVLRAWLFEHFLHPYPTDTDKIMLATQTGLTRNQVSNWFINARVRLWKPMVEEIHMLETRKNQDPNDQPQQNPSKLNDPGCSETNAISSGEVSPKRTRKNPIEATLDGLNDGMMSNATFVGATSGVSLTLGLHQNTGLSDPYYSLNTVRQLGLDSRSEARVVSELAAQNRVFGTGGVGGAGSQLMRDFVG